MSFVKTNIGISLSANLPAYLWLMGCKRIPLTGLTLLLDSEVCAANTHRAVIENILPIQSAFKDYL